ncbi:hypothetical protein [uncultured Helicobacter sp.]|uniref:hypothetical protein n=1 Tax=uncultured Helicobacter sp. TaxID=175537 RepID=UPI00374E32F8
MFALPRFKAYFLRVMSVYPLGLITLSVYFAYVLWAIVMSSPAALFIHWSNFCVFVCLFAFVVDAITHKIHTGDRVTRVSFGAIVVVVVSMVVYHTIFKHGFATKVLEGAAGEIIVLSRTPSLSYVYYYLGFNAIVLGVLVYAVLGDLERFVRFVGQICVSVLLWALGLGLLGLIYASAHMLDLDKMAFFSKFWKIPAPVIMCLYAYGLSVRLLGFLINLRGGSSTSARPLATILLWVFNIFAFAYVALLAIYALSPQKYFDGVVHLVLWFGIFLILLAWSNALSGKSKLCLVFLAVALVLESIAIWAIGVRIGEYGFTPARIFVLLAGVFFAFVALAHIVLESGILESKDTESKLTSDIIESVESKQKDSESVWSRSGGARSFTLSPDKQGQCSCSDIIESKPTSDIIESKHKNQNLMRAIAVAFVLCFGIGGFATPSVSIHSQLRQLETIKATLDNPRTLHTKTQDEIDALIKSYNSALDFLGEFDQEGDRKHLSALDYHSSVRLDSKHTSESLESKADPNKVQRNGEEYYFGFYQVLDLHSYIDVMVEVSGLRDVCWGDTLGYDEEKGYFYHDVYAFKLCEDTLKVYDVVDHKEGKRTYKLLLEVPHLSQKIFDAHEDHIKLLSFTNKKRDFELMLVLDRYVRVASEYDPKSNTRKQWVTNLNATALITKK